MRTYLKRFVRIERKGERGYTLLEYVAGAAIIGGVVFTAVSGFGGNMATFFNSLGSWASGRSASLQPNVPTPNP